MKRLLCKILGHKYFAIAKPKGSSGKGVRWLKCSRCKGNFAINDRVKVIVPMNFEIMDNREWVNL